MSHVSRDTSLKAQKAVAVERAGGCHIDEPRGLALISVADIGHLVIPQAIGKDNLSWLYTVTELLAFYNGKALIFAIVYLPFPGPGTARYSRYLSQSSNTPYRSLVSLRYELFTLSFIRTAHCGNMDVRILTVLSVWQGTPVAVESCVLRQLLSII